MIKPLIVREKPVSHERVLEFKLQLKEAGIPLDSMLVKILLARQVNTVQKAKRFLAPELQTMYDPFLMKDMQKAVDLIRSHVGSSSKIMIYGDYDVDGVTSTSILYKMLQRCGADVDFYIPDRIDEGYGINTDALATIHESGAGLVISVDTGITAVEQVRYGRELGLDVIITDHHECQDIIPDASAVINPKQEDCSYPFKSLAGVGVTYKLIQALQKDLEIEEEFVLDLLEIVAVGTISDLVPLIDENRTFVYQAFKRMHPVKNIGLDALIQVSGVNTEKMTAGSIGFQIGPRLNAAGRLGDAKRGVKLFLTDDREEAIAIAEALDRENQKRREMEEEIFLKADEIIREQMDAKASRILVVAYEGWHHGVIGIVASRITEKYYRPTILLTVENGIASGSARSVDGFSIFDALYASRTLMDKFGGHEMAAGMSFPAERIGELREALNAYAREHMTDDTLIPKVDVEKRMEPGDISVDFIQSLHRLEPYGMGNEEPRFLVHGDVASLDLMGKERNHFKMSLTDSTDALEKTAPGLKNGELEMVGFYSPEYFEDLVRNMDVGVIGTLNVNEWKGYRKPQLFIKAIRYSDDYRMFLDRADEFAQILLSDVDAAAEAGFDSCVPDGMSVGREDCVKVYKSLKQLAANGIGSESLARIHQLIMPGVDGYEGNTCKSIAVLRILKDIKVIGCSYSVDKQFGFELIPTKKVELEKSALYNYMCWNNRKGEI